LSEGRHRPGNEQSVMAGKSKDKKKESKGKKKKDKQ
jgi:hypothetical protein